MSSIDVAERRTIISDLLPLIVDLDGTLIRSNLLIETCFAAIGRDSHIAFSAIRSLAFGKAELKKIFADNVDFDPALLPYDEAVLRLVREAQEAGREVYLASASNDRLVAAVAEHIGLFTGWMASGDSRNLSGRSKAAMLVERFGSGGFDYIGNDRADLAVWRHAAVAITVRVSRITRGKLERSHANVIHLKSDRPTLKQWAMLLRVHQYAKNGLLLVPLLTAHAFDLQSLIHALLGVVAFSACASGVYLLNDLIDIQADRLHPTKQFRPLASGTIPVGYAVAVMPVLFLVSAGIALCVSFQFLLILFGYFLLTTAYSLLLKRKMIIDVVTLAGLYSIRVFAGAIAIDVVMSEWLLGFSMFIFMSLALIKRYVELALRLDLGMPDPKNRNYKLSDLPLVAMMAAACGFNAVTVLALYLSSPDVHLLYRTPRLLWLLCPVIMYWISRMLLMAHRRFVPEDPIIFAVRDRVSLVTLAICLLITLAASLVG
jgi:4-hydroxybenzoate polyprenyltransferase